MRSAPNAACAMWCVVRSISTQSSYHPRPSIFWRSTSDASIRSAPFASCIVPRKDRLSMQIAGDRWFLRLPKCGPRKCSGHVPRRRNVHNCKAASDEWKAARARAGYAAEGPFMSIKQMSTQILSVTVDEQSKYIDLQRMRARQIWDEVKHGQLHADVLLRGGWIKREEELMNDA